MSIEQRLEQVEKQTKRLRIAVVVLATALCGVVSMAATEKVDGRFDAVYAKSIYVKNYKGETAVAMGSTSDGSGLVSTYNGKTDKKLVSFGEGVDGNGMVITYASTDKPSVMLYSNENGGKISVFNKTIENIVTIGADDYGNGEVGAWNRKGKGRVWRSQ